MDFERFELGEGCIVNIENKQDITEKFKSEQTDWKPRFLCFSEFC